MSSLDGITDLKDMNLRKLPEIVDSRGAWCAAVRDLVTEQQQISIALFISVLK